MCNVPNAEWKSKNYQSPELDQYNTLMLSWSQMLATCLHRYSKGRSKSTDSHHCYYNLEISINPWSHRTVPFLTTLSRRHYWKKKKSGSEGTSCMVIQIVPQRIVKYGGMFCGFVWKKCLCYSSSTALPVYFERPSLLSSFSDKLLISLAMKGAW